MFHSLLQLSIAMHSQVWAPVMFRETIDVAAWDAMLWTWSGWLFLVGLTADVLTRTVLQFPSLYHGVISPILDLKKQFFFEVLIPFALNCHNQFMVMDRSLSLLARNAVMESSLLIAVGMLLLVPLLCLLR